MEKSADICLVIEGSYPYAVGGVSSWVQWLMENLREFSFSVVALVAEARKKEDRHYRLPDNVVSYDEYVIFDYTEIQTAPPLKLSQKQWQALADRLMALMAEWRAGRLSPSGIMFLRELATVRSPRIFRNFLEDEMAFAVLTRIGESVREHAGFMKYFYNVHNIHLVLFRLLSLVSRLPVSAIYHAPGTGYAGLMACLRAALFGGQAVITEHGIYLQERELDLLQTDWLEEPYLREMWLDMFSAICRWQYRFCDRIITLSQRNKQLQIGYGAAPEQVCVIPNGVRLSRFEAARRPRCTEPPGLIGFVGRVDRIKDIKTFIQAMSVIRKSRPGVKGLIVGPRTAQPDYYRECRDLIRMLGLESALTFTGQAEVVGYYRQMDLLLLTSIKEGMPLVVMEAMASGLPVVATDVGNCDELLCGIDDGIGPAGRVVRVMDADGIAAAAIGILRDTEMANEMGRNGIRRIRRFYREELIISQYRQIYEEARDGRHASLH